MLFNSYLFLFAFLPVSLAGLLLASRLGARASAIWLILASFVFYGWWTPRFVVLLLISIGFNYAASEIIGACRTRPGLQTTCLTLAIMANIAALVFFKYLAAVIDGLHALGMVDTTPPTILLPLGISFFTFTQIGYLVDRRQDLVKERGLVSYVLFVTFFPHLIAGPILHNREIMPQFRDAGTYRFLPDNLVAGLTLFVIGLGKKCLLADPLSTDVAAGFGAAGQSSMLASWDTMLCYALQLYFDFSGYSDMAIGLARMFNIRFPLNFNSPFKAGSIIEFWQRWHMTLSRYLNLYVYGPFALALTRWRSRRGLPVGRAAHARIGGFGMMVLLPTVTTMTLAGVWHGAGLQFLIFGLLHGIYLVINHAWRVIRPHNARTAASRPLLVHQLNVLLTFLAVLVASVFFRAPGVEAAFDMLGGMVGWHGIGTVQLPAALLASLGNALPVGMTTVISPIDFIQLLAHIAWLAVLFVIVWGMPNSQQIMQRTGPALGRVEVSAWPLLSWRPTRGWALVVGVLASMSVLAVGGTSEFLYFRF